MQSADIVIVGGGVVGSSIAYQCLKRGVGSLLVVDTAQSSGQGSTRYATGGYRAQHSTDINVRLSLLAREQLLSFHSDTGIDCEYRPCGYLMAARSSEQLVLLRKALAVQHAAGLDVSREVSIDEMRAINPFLNTTDLIGGTYCPIDGFIRPLQVLEGYQAASKALGAVYRFGFGTVDILFDNDQKAVGVKVDGDTIHSGCVVIAAGAWSGLIKGNGQYHIPVRPERRQVACTVVQDLLAENLPLTIDIENGFHMRVRDGRCLLLWPGESSGANEFDIMFDTGWLEQMIPLAHHFIPCLKDIALDSEKHWCGLYEMTPDHHCLFGKVPNSEALYIATGNSGHGVMHAPALGVLMADLLSSGKTRLDTHCLRPSRFMENDAISDLGIL